MKISLASLALLTLVLPAGAQRLVKDINTNAENRASNPSGLHVFDSGRKVLMNAWDGVHGRDLYVTDGTAAGTQILLDFKAIPKVVAVINLGRSVLMALDDGVHGSELWITDGTRAGTRMVVDMMPGKQGSSPYWFFEFGGRVLFRATHPTKGVGLFETDGTTAGTRFLLNTPRAFRHPVALGTKILFGAMNSTNGTELWISDGTPAGTKMLKDLVPGAGHGSPHQLVRVGNKVFFAAGAYPDVNLWCTDGTATGTRLLYDFGLGCGAFVPFGNSVLFQGHTAAHDWELWRSDGTVAGTIMLTNEVNSRSLPNPGSGIDVIGNRAYFFAGSTSTGYEPWVTDGTKAGTRMLKDIFSGGSSGQNFGFHAVGGIVYFAAYELTTGAELWQTDGTPQGTKLAADINPGTDHSYPRRFAALQNGLVFVARDGKIEGELFIKRPGKAPTLLKDINPLRTLDSAPIFRQEMDDGRVLFLATENRSNYELWISDGTKAGTELVKEIKPGTGSGFHGHRPDSVRYRGRVYFSADDGATGREPWVTDGTTGGTHPLVDLVPGAVGSDPRWFANYADRLWFGTADAIYVSDGTASGTSRFAQLSARELRIFNGLAYFMVEKTLSIELWRTDGTAANTRLVEVLGVASGADLGEFVVAEKQMFFAFNANDGRGRELWRSDGTAAGTHMVKDIHQGAAWSWPEEPRPLGDRVVFRATTADGYEPWVSDGTAAGTRTLGDLHRTGSSNPFFAPAGGGVVLFSADDGVHGRELWRTDGTPSGTKMVVDLMPGPRSGVSFQVWSAGDGPQVLFAGDNGGSGAEPYVSDGTAAGTRLVGDINTGVGSSTPGNFFAANDTVYFTATARTTGHELFAVDMAKIGASRVVPYGFGCISSGRTPRLGGTPPRLGRPSATAIAGARPNTVCGLGIGMQRAKLAIGAGCHLQVDPVLLLLFGRTDGAGGFAIQSTVPNQAALVGGSVMLCAFVADPAGPLGLSLTGGLHKVIGR